MNNKTLNQFNLSLIYTLETNPLKKIKDICLATLSIDNSISKLTKILKHQISSENFNEILYEHSYSFKEIYAHNRCYVLFEALQNELSLYFETKGMILIDNNNKAAHYVTQIISNRKSYYIDAYGIFTSLENITSRYKNTTITESIPFDPNDDNHHYYQKFKDQMIETYDMMAEFSDDIDIEISYLEYFYKHLVEKLLKLILGLTQQ